MTYSFEDTMYGTLGPERTVWDEEAHESTKKTIKKQKESTLVMGTGTWVWVPVFMAIFLQYS